MKFIEMIPHDTKYDFIGKSKYYIAVSVILVAVSLASILFRGFNWNVEFAGGIEMRVELTAAGAEISDVREVMNRLAKDLKVSNVQVNSFTMEGRNVFAILTKGSEGATDLNALSASMEKALKTHYGSDNVSIVSMDMIGPRVGATMRVRAVYSILFALLGILLYIGIRFNFRFAPGGIIALAHDVIITAGLFSLLGREMSLSVLAALLTVAGYSINDTIVIFDRIREQSLTRNRSIPTNQYVNQAINETLSRTVLTSLTTLLAILALLIFGGNILFDFALAMLIGCTAGVYSTLFIASPIYVGLERLNAIRERTRKPKSNDAKKLKKRVSDNR